MGHLAVAVGYAQLLQRKLERGNMDEHEFQTFLGTIEQAAWKASQIVQDVERRKGIAG